MDIRIWWPFKGKERKNGLKKKIKASPWLSWKENKVTIEICTTTRRRIFILVCDCPVHSHLEKERIANALLDIITQVGMSKYSTDCMVFEVGAAVHASQFSI
jgi:hypothetical protein